MEKRIEDLERTVAMLQEEVALLRELLTSGFQKSESNFKSIQLSVGLLNRAKLSDEIDQLTAKPVS